MAAWFLFYLFLAQTRSRSRVSRTHHAPPPPPTHHHHSTPPHCPPLPLYTARLKPSHIGLVSVFWPKPVLGLAFRERTTPPSPPPPTHHHSTPPHRPPLPLHTVRPKPSHIGSVSTFWPKPVPGLAFRERTTPPSPPPPTHHHSTPPHCPPLPLYTARPKPSYISLVLVFWPKPCRFTRRAQNQATAAQPPRFP
jgi:hypothetical protein